MTDDGGMGFLPQWDFAFVSEGRVTFLNDPLTAEGGVLFFFFPSSSSSSLGYLLSLRASVETRRKTDQNEGSPLGENERQRLL